MYVGPYLSVCLSIYLSCLAMFWKPYLSSLSKGHKHCRSLVLNNKNSKEFFRKCDNLKVSRPTDYFLLCLFYICLFICLLAFFFCRRKNSSGTLLHITLALNKTRYPNPNVQVYLVIYFSLYNLS